MIKDDAHILIAEHRHPQRGHVERYSFEWRGGTAAQIHRHDPLGLYNFEDANLGDVIQLGSLRLRVIDVDYYTYSGGSLCVMRDGWRAALRYRMRYIFGLAELTYRRLILTAVVWNLADYEPAVVPSWHNLKIVKKWRKWCF